jgi:hypothetical protein
VVDDGKLCQKIRKAIAARVLPDRRPERMWGGSGSGADCVLCGEPVTAQQTELELEFAAGERDKGPTSYPVHVRCFSVWEMERASASGKLLQGTSEHGTMSDRERDRTQTRGPG